jgi:vancomycin resistance protein YoaR
MRTFLRILTVLAVISALTALSLVTYDFIITRGALPPKTYIAGVDFSLLTYDEALTKLAKYSAAELYAPSIVLEAEDNLYSFPPEKLGVHIVYKQTVKNAFKMTHRGNYFTSLRERLTEEATFAPLVLGIKNDQLKAVFEALASEIDQPSKEASMTINEKTGGYHIKPHVIGKEVQIKENMERFGERLYSGERAMALLIKYIEPRVKEDDLRAHPPVYRLSAYTTYYGKHDSPNRIHNIRLVSSWINGTILMPGEVFSVADILGDVSSEQGFKEAFVIIKSELVPLLGGGSCQIATTLYNAAALADLKIVERRNHSFYFNIYPLGRDAAVYPGQIDFKFENDTPYPLLIKTFATNRRLSFRLYGTPSGKTAKFSSTKVYGLSESGKFVRMPLKDVIEQDIPFRTEVKRTVDEKRKKIKEDFIRSRYKMYGDKENVPIKRPEPR